MNSARVRKTVKLLKEVRSGMRDAVDARVTKNLDEAIEILEVEVTTSEEEAKRNNSALSKLGEALKYLPAVKAIIDEIFR